MATRAKHGFRVPALFTATSLSSVPKTYRGGLADPAWRSAMLEEYDALLQNHTWDLVPRSRQANVVTGKWIFKHKFSADGTLERSARLSNRRRFALCSPWLSHGDGLFTSLM
jgi:hypothetical protein